MRHRHLKLPVPSPPKKKSKLSRLLKKPVCTTQIIVHSALSEVDNYLLEDCIPEENNPLEYWKNSQHKFPNLAKLAAKYLSIPASSGAVERLFSVAGNIFRPNRCNLSDSNFEKLVFIRTNKHFV